MIPAMITVRTGSSRLPNKCLLPFGEMTVLQHVIRRCKYFQFDSIVATTELEEDDQVESIAHDEGVKVYRGPVEDKLKRWRGACEKFNLKAFHTVDADDLFFDDLAIDTSFTTLVDNKLDVVYPIPVYYLGACGYSMTTKFLDKVCIFKSSDNTEMIEKHLEKVIGAKVVKFKTQPPSIRLTLDYGEDYWLLCTVREILGQFCAGEDIVRLFQKNPDLYKVNWFRNKEWKVKQDADKKD